MNAPKRSSGRVAGLSIEQIEFNNGSIREEAYKLIYFIVDNFPLDAFLGKGLLPITELQLKGFYSGPRLPECPPPADVRMMAEYSITNLEWNGTQEGDLVRSDAQEHLASALDELYGGLSNSEAQNFNPKPPAEI
jgi:hypothetical protein